MKNRLSDGLFAVSASELHEHPLWVRIVPAAWLTTFSRIWQWLTWVHRDDPVRYTLNRGFASIMIVMILLAVLLTLAFLISNEPTPTKIVGFAGIVINIFIWWLNRRGTVYGAVLFVIWMILGTSIGITPTSVISPGAPIPLILAFAPLAATLFIRPQAGLWAVALQMGVLGLMLALAGVPYEAWQRFMLIGAQNLGAFTVFLIVGATMFVRALRSSIAANEALTQLNAELEQRITERTAELLEAKEVAEHARAAAEEANRYKSRFLANMGHELRTPLNAIINFAHFLADTEYGPVTERQQMFQSRIVYNGEHLLGLINDILDLSKIEAGKMELVREIAEVSPLLKGVLATAIGLTKDKGLSLELKTDDELPPVWIDQIRIRQVLLNLLSNAAKFTEKGGIIVRAERMNERVNPLTEAGDEGGTPSRGQVMKNSSEDDSFILHPSSFILISLSDTGIGIAPADQGRVFEEFQQVQDEFNRAHQGTGLGLPISKRLIEMHGGWMWLESTPGVGSTFYFTLPVALTPLPERVEPPQKSASAPALTEAMETRLIAVIDDDEDAQRILSTMLGRAGYRVQHITDSQAALVELRRQRPALIVLDLKMAPLDGWALLDQLEDDPLLAALPVIICSVVDAEQGQISLLPNVVGYLPKPVRQTELMELVRQVAPSGMVLLVEDDPVARRILHQMLDQLSYEVIEVTTGQMALALLAEVRPSLILLDLLLPDIDGFTVLEYMQELPTAAHVPVIVVTGRKLDEAQRIWLAERTAHCLEKPVSEPEFLSMIRHVLQGVDL